MMITAIGHIYPILGYNSVVQNAQISDFKKRKNQAFEILYRHFHKTCLRIQTKSL